jgi:hypothetical protein
LARGDVIFFSDQDDVWLPEKIAVMLTAMAAQPDKMLFFSDSMRFDHDWQVCHGTSLGLYGAASEVAQWAAQVNNAAAFPLWTRYIFMPALHNMAVRRALVANLSPVPESSKYLDEWLMFCAGYWETAWCVPQVLMHYRRHAATASQSLRVKNGWRQQVAYYWRRLFDWQIATEVAKTNAAFSELAPRTVCRLGAGKTLAAPPRNQELLAQLLAFGDFRLTLLALPRWRRWVKIWRRRRDYARLANSKLSQVRDCLAPSVAAKLAPPVAAKYDEKTDHQCG